MFAKMMERENERQRETERERNETYVGRDMGFVNNMGSADVVIILLPFPFFSYLRFSFLSFISVYLVLDFFLMKWNSAQFFLFGVGIVL